MRYKIKLDYDGSDFCGWQRQPDAPSVQETLENALSTLLHTQVGVVGAGRTDTGVNARGYIAHFDCPEAFDCAQIRYKLNAILPRSIAIIELSLTEDGFHARFDAKRREYTYYLHRTKDPFVDRYSYFYGYPGLDFDAMNKAAEALLGTHDFSCFEKTGGDNRTSVCTVFSAGWTKITPDGSQLRFDIAADRFLRNMVRAIVGTLLEVGRGRREPGSVAEIIRECDNAGDDAQSRRHLAGESVPGHALFLSGIYY